MANAFQKMLRFMQNKTLNEVILQWWYSEGARVFKTKGGRISENWGTDNVKTGTLKKAVTGKAGSFIKASQNTMVMGIIYDKRAFVVINNVRPVYDLRSTQMVSLDQNIQRRLDRDIG